MQKFEVYKENVEMKCVYCEQEMKKGTVLFMSVQGLGQMILSFTSETDEKKNFFKRESEEKIIFSGEETEAYCCTCCNKIMPIINL